MKKLAILVPYRDREEHLQAFVPHMERFFDGEPLEFKIVAVEQHGRKPFNRAKLLNTGFALLCDAYDYFCFHDVDMLPEAKAADYSWVSAPTHMAALVSQYDYRLPYETYFGGVTLFNNEDFQRVNGCSNEYWGWGLEDNDLFYRCKLEGLEPYRRMGRYRSLWHEPNAVMLDRKNISKETAGNRRRWLRFVNGEVDYKSDGLNSLRYEVVSRKTIFDRHDMVTVDI